MAKQKVVVTKKEVVVRCSDQPMPTCTMRSIRYPKANEELALEEGGAVRLRKVVPAKS